MSARIIDFAAERSKRRPYAAEAVATLQVLATLSNRWANYGIAAMANAELAYRARRGPDDGLKVVG